MTREEALKKDKALLALKEDILRLPMTVVSVDGTTFTPKVDRTAVLQLITKYVRS